MKSNPKPIKGNAKHTVDLVMADFKLRKKAGKKKYGVAHQHDNGRNHLLDLYEELMDACVYIRAQLEKTK
jgi:hypothetical protein